ncbi:hypothetical protein LTR62_005860 [Meristemomyces frigidus]|uniref:Transcription factor CBF/NF-Y/archaeal histone domain-containing protein n=1 Tax=Meristemomyces frigidus TaxID=1508187 RepID=A0AAN7THD9_9PEZI|nr:hypothetical protein LTR62_005860 [Meristemomyces frigidus]
MPYNNTPIAPTSDVTGTVSLPLARVKKIINTDEDINTCSNNAAFVITAATEMFLQYLVEQSYNVVKSERKPRRNIQYRDVANAVARVENLEFLADVVPKTTTYKAFKQKIAAAGKDTAAATQGTNGVGEAEQGTLDGHVNGNTVGEVEDAEEKQAANSASHRAELEVDVGPEDGRVTNGGRSEERREAAKANAGEGKLDAEEDEDEIMYAD